MYLPIETVTESAGLDEQLREHYSMKAFREYEQGTVLGQFYEFWDSQRQDESRLPVISDEMLCTSVSNEILQWTSWIDTQSENPMEYVIQACGDRLLPEYCAGVGNTLVIDIPCIFHAIQLAIECLACKHDRTAAYHVINQTIGGVHSHYARLLLPVGGTEGDVVKIIQIVRPVSVTQNVEALA